MGTVFFISLKHLLLIFAGIVALFLLVVILRKSK